MTRAVLLAVAPTARAVTWSPIAVAAAVLLPLALLVRLGDQPGARVALLAVATLAAVAVAAVRDPAGGLVAATPVPPMARRLLRASLATVAAAGVWLALDLLLPGPPSGLVLVGCALVLGGVALATWLPEYVDARAAAAAPLVWLMGSVVVGSSGLMADLAAAWWADAWVAATLAAVALVLGRHR